mmetsp:Transcript_26848/g.44339  ORF Transcript_26848/g.44339 Transcript_26848/m.44339 type:complete len:270 (+) Transcript_26848:63-872(+)
MATSSGLLVALASLVLLQKNTGFLLNQPSRSAQAVSLFQLSAETKDARSALEIFLFGNGPLQDNRNSEDNDAIEVISVREEQTISSADKSTQPLISSYGATKSGYRQGASSYYSNRLDSSTGDAFTDALIVEPEVLARAEELDQPTEEVVEPEVLAETEDLVQPIEEVVQVPVASEQPITSEVPTAMSTSEPISVSQQEEKPAVAAAEQVAAPEPVAQETEKPAAATVEQVVAPEELVQIRVQGVTVRVPAAKAQKMVEDGEATLVVRK